MDRLESRVFAVPFDGERVPRRHTLADLWTAFHQNLCTSRHVLWAWEVCTCGTLYESGGHRGGEIVAYGLHVREDLAASAVAFFARELNAAAVLHFADSGGASRPGPPFDGSLPKSRREFHSAVDHLAYLAWGERCQDFLTDPALMTWQGSMGLSMRHSAEQLLALARHYDITPRHVGGLGHPLVPGGGYERVVAERDREEAKLDAAVATSE